MGRVTSPKDDEFKADLQKFMGRLNLIPLKEEDGPTYEGIQSELHKTPDINIVMNISLPGTIYCGKCKYLTTLEFQDYCKLFDTNLKTIGKYSKTNRYDIFKAKCPKCLEKCGLVKE
jgi:hypothetical protein